MTEITKKPWGKEYLLYENDDVAIWHLILDPWQSTSLHAHPNKKTGLVVLKGAAEVSFLSSKQAVLTGQKVMIRQGVFHQTKCMTSCGLEMLEIETPVDKADLVRLEDGYGRAGKPYTHESCGETDKGIHDGVFGDCILKYHEITRANVEKLFNCSNPDAPFMFLSGGFVSSRMF